MFGVTILGNNSAVPAYDRHPTAQLVTMDDATFLLDCGEGTQMQMTRYRIRRSRISHIFISHLHGDHYFGLIGLLMSMGLLGREEVLHLYAPEQLLDIINLQLNAADSELPFPLQFYPVNKEEILLNTNNYSVECFRVYHIINCWGFLISQKKKPRKLAVAEALRYEVPVTFYERLKDGEDYTNEQGEVIKNEWVTKANPPGKRYAYCADTLYSEDIASKIKNVTMLYHEATYLHEQEHKAKMHFHSTTMQAAAIAKLANAEQLLIGHFSSKYEKLQPFITEARQVFANTNLALEGATYIV